MNAAPLFSTDEQVEESIKHLEGIKQAMNAGKIARTESDMKGTLPKLMFSERTANDLLAAVLMIKKLRADNADLKGATIPRPIDEWHEDFGDVLWWSFPIQEPPYCGSPLAYDWPGCHTHWTPIIIPNNPEDDGTNDDCPSCNNIYKKCSCGHDNDWPNW